MSDGQHLRYGYELFIIGLTSVFIVVLAPLHVISWATNILFVRELWRLAIVYRSPPPELEPIGPAIALLINLILAAVGTVRPQLSDELTLPGFYVWMASFVLLLIAALRAESFPYPRLRVHRSGLDPKLKTEH